MHKQQQQVYYMPEYVQQRQQPHYHRQPTPQAHQHNYMHKPPQMHVQRISGQPQQQRRPSIQELLQRQAQLKREWQMFVGKYPNKAGPTVDDKIKYMRAQEALELAINEQMQGNEIQEEQPIMDRPTTDPQFYDQMFHAQTRLQGTESIERKLIQKQGNQTAMDYHLFAPKFENHTDSSGYQDTWRPQLHIKREERETIGGGRRGEERVNFPGRTAPPPPGTATHPLPNRRYGDDQAYISPFQSKEQQVNKFNQTIDSLHLPDDMQRPVATRDFVKQTEDFKGNSVSIPTKGSAPRLDNNYIMDRQMNYETTLPLGSAATYEDMFY
jgi:hypothetical protein